MFVARGDVGRNGFVIVTIYSGPSVCQELVAEGLYTWSHFIFLITIQSISIFILIEHRRKLRLRENKLFSRAYKANTIGACANSYSGQMKSWNSRWEVSTGTCGTGRQAIGVRVMGEAGQRVVISPAICYMDHSIRLLAFQPSTI